MATNTDEVSLEYRGNLAIITLNVPKKLNAMSADSFHKVASSLRAIAKRDDILITIFTGKGRFFSAGADVTQGRVVDPSVEPRRHYLRNFVSQNLEITHAFYSHPKILVTALNGPVIGLSAALVAYSDFIYAAPHTYLLTPFTSLGLVAEGGASKAFVERLGISKANEALIMSKKLTIEDLVGCGFVNKVMEGVQPGEDEKFLGMVLDEVRDRLGEHLVGSSVLKIKGLIRKPEMMVNDSQLVAEVLGGLERFEEEIPQREFMRVASGEKKHKM